MWHRMLFFFFMLCGVVLLPSSLLVGPFPRATNSFRLPGGLRPLARSSCSIRTSPNPPIAFRSSPSAYTTLPYIYIVHRQTDACRCISHTRPRTRALFTGAHPASEPFRHAAYCMHPKHTAKHNQPTCTRTQNRKQHTQNIGQTKGAPCHGRAERQREREGQGRGPIRPLATTAIHTTMHSDDMTNTRTYTSEHIRTTHTNNTDLRTCSARYVADDIFSCGGCGAAMGF